MLHVMEPFWSEVAREFWLRKGALQSENLFYTMLLISHLSILCYTKGDNSPLRNFEALAALPCVSVWLDSSLRHVSSAWELRQLLICRQAWWDNFHILLCRLWSPLSPHQHGYACGLVPPHHTIMTVPGYVFFNVLSRPLPSDLLSAVKFVLWARIALLKQNSSTVEELNGVDYCWIISITRFRHYTSCVWQDISSHPTLHYILVIYLVYIVLHYLYLHFQYDLLPMGAHRRVFGFEFIKVESSALILFFLCFVNTHPDTRDQQPHYNWA